MKPWKLLLLLTTILILIGVIFQTSFKGQPTVETQISPLGGSNPDPAFMRADRPREFIFPEDHGAHPDYQTEWWYYTGNLISVNGEQFGYQLTFFRRALVAPVNFQPRTSDWATQQIYMAHFALTDTDKRQHQSFERFSRGAAGLAGARAEPFKVWLENWQVAEVSTLAETCPDGFTQPCAYQLQAEQGDIKLQFTLTDTKGPVLQGNAGYSLKGTAPGQASYYYSLTNLNTKGTIQIGDRNYVVSGSSWMDHEFSTSALSIEQVGWDWFSFQLDNGIDLMLFQIRRADGSIDPFSSGTWIDQDGRSTSLTHEDFSITVGDRWISPYSKAIYPSKWSIDIPKYGLSIEVTPLLTDQELNLSYTYWEGAVELRGNKYNEPISGIGYIEMTGYAKSMGGEF